MKIIIDAYNVLHCINASDRVTDNQRKAFIKQLGVYARQKGHVVIAVFDGGPVLFASSARINGITVVYSGPHMSADEFILNYSKEHVGHHMLLVSSDNELCQAAMLYNVESIRSDDFYSIFKQHVQQGILTKVGGQVVKMSKHSSAMDHLMSEQVEVPLKVEDVQNQVELRNKKSTTLSKKERNRMHILKKL